MSDNYAVINGKKIELTEEHLKALGVKTRKNPFKRVAAEEYYYCIKSAGGVERFQDRRDSFDNNVYSKSNYFNDKEFAKQIALHQLLYRKLLKFSYDNGCDDIEWDLRNRHWYIFYNYTNKHFYVQSNDLFKHQDVYFASQARAERAIKDVIEPFIEEHPEFEW